MNKQHVAPTRVTYLSPQSGLLVIPISSRLEISRRPLATKQVLHLFIVKREAIDNKLLRPELIRLALLLNLEDLLHLQGAEQP
jgi:hypothetical protein